MSRFDTPLLESLTVTLFDCLVLDTPQLRHFISHTEMFTALRRADVTFDFDDCDSDIGVTFFPSNGSASPDSDGGALTLGVRYTDSGQGSMSLVRLCNSSLPPSPL